MFSPRTIFLFIRGINQTGMALTDVSNGLKNVEERQKSLAQASYRLAFAGAAFVAFGAMLAGTMIKMLDASYRGQRVLGDFDRVIERIKRSFAEATLNLFGEQIKGVIESLDAFSKDKEKMELATEITWAVIIGSITLGGIALAGAGVAFLLSVLGNALKIPAITQLGSAQVIGGAIRFFLPGVVILGLEWITENMFGKTPQEARIQSLSLNPIIGSNQYLQNTLSNPNLLRDPIGTFMGKYETKTWMEKETEKLHNITITIENLFTKSNKEDLNDSLIDTVILPLVNLQGSEIN